MRKFCTRILWIHIKNIVLIYSLLETINIYKDYKNFFCFAIYKMVDSEYIMGTYKPVKISIGTVTRNPGTLKFFPDHLKTKKCLSMELKSYLIY